MRVKFLETSVDTGIKWYELSGTDFGTKISFQSEMFGLTHDDIILDSDGFPLTEGDFVTVAVRNSI